MKEAKAFKITPETYAAFEKLAPQRVLPLKMINNQFYVVDEKLNRGWGWFDELYFRRYYKYSDKIMSKTGFTVVERRVED